MKQARVTLLVFLSAIIVLAQGGLKSINNLDGGKIVYGQVEGQTTEAGAMGALLRSVHSQYGDRPQVGKLFQVRGTQSVAAFFSVNKRAAGGGQIAGLIMVAKITTDHVEGAVISDDASRFGTSFGPLMKSLFAAWHPFEGASRGSGGAALHKFVTQDRTASVDLPDGWKPQEGSGGGTIMADGPNGEYVNLGFAILVNDLNNPNARRTYQSVMRGGMPGSAPANALYYQLGGDMAKTYVDVIQMLRKKRNLPASQFQMKSLGPVPAPPAERCDHLVGILDPQDSTKAKELNIIFCISRPTPAAGLFLAIVNATGIPLQSVEKERSTMGAVLASFSVDTAAVQRMAHNYAAPAIEAIHATGRAAAAQAAAAHQRNEIHNSSVYQHWDDIDRRSKEFSNYQLGYSVVRDVGNNYHGTFWNADAEALVSGHPDKFEYVAAPDFWKGIDY